MKYKAVVFDYAGVLAGDIASSFDDGISRIIGVSVEDYKKVYYRHNDLHNTGKISWEELWKRVLVDLDKTEYLKEIIDFVTKPKSLNINVVSIVKKLKANGYKVVLLSNYSKKGGRRMRKVMHLDKIFDLMLISGETGLAKPHPEAFLDLINRLNVLPSEIIFIDDSPKNIKTAKELGIVTVLCENPKVLDHQLYVMGIL